MLAIFHAVLLTLAVVTLAVLKFAMRALSR
jgi:hypothetical protein